MSSDLRARHRRLGAPRRRGATVPRLGAGLLSLLLLSGCTGRDLALPVAASDRAEYVDELWVAAWIAAGVIGVFVAGLGVWAAVAYRRRSDDEVPKQVRYNLPLEVLYTIAPVIVIAVFFFHTVKTNNELLNRLPDDEADHRIVVIGQKWSWSFNYMEEEATNGESVFTVGTPADRPTLVLPVGETVRFDLQSQDVIHAFWVPAFYFKLDVLPGQGANAGTGTNTFSLTPTREGTYAGRCSELCGLYHSRMLFTVEVVSREEFDEALVELQEQGNTGQLKYASEIEEVAGMEDEETAESATEDGAE